MNKPTIVEAFFIAVGLIGVGCLLAAGIGFIAGIIECAIESGRPGLLGRRPMARKVSR